MAIRVMSWKPFEKNTLRGFCNLKLEKTGMEIRGCMLHEKNDSRWIALPGKPYDDPEGNRKYEIVIRFDNAAHQQFQRQALAAIDDFLNTTAKAPELNL